MNLIHSKRMGALLALVLAAAGCGGSSSSTTNTVIAGTINGTVKNAGGSALANVTVTAQGAGTPAFVTGSDGKFTLSVPPGSYTVSFAGDNLEPATASSGPVGSGATVTLPDQVMAASALKVTVNLPAALRNGGPAGFGATISGISVGAKLNGNDVTPDSVAWVVKDYYGLSAPPDAAAVADPATGTTTSFAIGSFETVREGANAWMNARYGTTGTEGAFEYIQAPEREQLLSLGTQQSRAMAFMVKATVKSGNHTSTGSALVYPLTISNGGNTLPKGMSVVANAPCKPDATTHACTQAYAWTLQFLPMTATDATFGAAPAGLLQGADTKNPWLIPTETGVYKLQNGDAGTPIYFRVSTYHGVGKSDTDATGDDLVACASCHSGDYSLTGKFTEWASSAHGNHNWKDPLATPMPLVEFGLTGGDGPAYGESCLACHTVGYSKVPSADNGGFDDFAAAAGWTFPTTLGADAWASVTANPGMNHRASIQCENCHGPLEPTEHSQPEAIPALFSLPVSPVASMDAGICLVCHDALTHHDRGSLWAASGHANLELAIEEGAGSTSCARCHSAEGFMLYLPRQQSGTPGNLADVSTLSAATVHSQTCQTCHDPHTTELRVQGDTKQVAGMFSVPNAGDGALCVICHNSRSGAVKQGTYAISSWSRLGPHAACQGDMFAGRNAFFFTNLTATDTATTLPNLSAHAFMADTCADCHVKWVPPDLKAQYQVWNTNHTFRSSTQVCAECHAADIGARIQDGITAKMGTLTDRLSGILAAKLTQPAGFDTAAGARTDPDTGAKLGDPASLTVLPASVAAIVAVPTTDAVVVKLTDGSKFQVGLDKVYGVGTTAALLSLADDSTQTVAKAYFNLLFVNNDGAKGVHNPAFAAKVLDNAAAALNGVSIP
jgi:hypothetical protein